MTKEQFNELLDSNYVFVWLHNTQAFSTANFITVKFKIKRVRSFGIEVEANEFDINSLPFDGFNVYWFLKEPAEKFRL